MRMFRKFGESARHLTRGIAIANKIARRHFTNDPVAKCRLDAIIRFERAKKDGLSAKASAQAVGIPMSTLYRWRDRYHHYGVKGLENGSRRRIHPPTRTARTAELVQEILSLRQRHPWGKAIVREVLWREDVKVSVSTVGRVIGELLSKGKIVSSSAGKWYRQKRRHPRPWAVRQRKKPTVQYPGQIVQIDHMKVSVGLGYQVVVFTARDVMTNIGECMVAAAATATTAVRFLKRLQQRLPFDIASIQTDGGSEFKGEFERACQQLNIPLRIIPPYSPKHNSKVENFNGTVRREVFNFISDIELSVDGVQGVLDSFLDTYNRIRPNTGLIYWDEQHEKRYPTPYQYNQLLVAKVPQAILT